MNNFNKRPITFEELLKWKNEPLKNPRTNRKISLNSNLYKYFKTEFDKNFPEIKKKVSEPKKIEIQKFKLEDSIDDKDPVSLNYFWKLEDGIKKIVYEEDLNKLILYKDSHGLIRCFEIETISYLKAHKITKHPVSQEEIPKEIFDSIVEANLTEQRKNMTISDRGLTVFQKFSSISIFIDSEWFISLSKEKLKKFNYELSSFIKENFDKNQQKSISPDKILPKSESELNIMNLEAIQLYLLNEIDKLLDVKKEELKYMINYILVGALGIVIPEIKELYPDFSFSFST